MLHLSLRGDHEAAGFSSSSNWGHSCGVAGRVTSQQQSRRIAVVTVSAVGESGNASPFCCTEARTSTTRMDPTTGNLLIDYRAAAGSAEKLRQDIKELVSLAPEAIVAIGSEAVTLLQQATRVVPIVFTDVPDPIGAGFVDGMAKPGRNATGFMVFEFGMSGKWLELLKEIEPKREARGSFARPVYDRRGWPICRHPGDSAVAKGRITPDRCARCW